METPYGRGNDAPLRPLELIDDESLRGLVAMRRREMLWVIGVALSIGVAGQCLLNGPVVVEKSPFLALGLLYGFPIASLLLLSAVINHRFERACRRAGLSPEGIATFRAHLRQVPPRLPPMSAEEIVPVIRALDTARRHAAPP